MAVSLVLWHGDAVHRDDALPHPNEPEAQKPRLEKQVLLTLVVALAVTFAIAVSTGSTAGVFVALGGIALVLLYVNIRKRRWITVVLFTVGVIAGTIAARYAIDANDDCSGFGGGCGFGEALTWGLVVLVLVPTGLAAISDALGTAGPHTPWAIKHYSPEKLEDLRIRETLRKTKKSQPRSAR